MNSPMCKLVLPCMRNLLFMLMLCFVGCADQLDVSGLGDDNEDPEVGGDTQNASRSSTDLSRPSPDLVKPSSDDSATLDGDLPKDAPLDIAETDPKDTGVDTSSVIDTAVGVDSTAPVDSCVSTDHRCPIGDPSYKTCSARTSIDEQVAHAKATSPTDWKWGGPDIVHCSGLAPTPSAAGDSCSVMTITTSTGLFTATWCGEGALTGRFVRSTTAGSVCPYGTDPVAWW